MSRSGVGAILYVGKRMITEQTVCSLFAPHLAELSKTKYIRTIDWQLNAAAQAHVQHANFGLSLYDKLGHEYLREMLIPLT